MRTFLHHLNQVNPLLGFYVLKNAKQVGMVRLLYGAITTLIFWQALRGKPLLTRTRPTVESALN